MLKQLIAPVTALITALSLAGCSAMNDKPADYATSDIISPSLPFKAQSNEPAWQLTITASHLELVQGYEQKSQQFTLVEQRQAGRVVITAGDKKELTAALTPNICHDSMTGMPYPWQAEVTVAGKTLQGCGGNPLELLLGEWQIEDINGEGIIDSSHLTITFDDKGQVYGSATCNRYGSSYELTSEGLTFGQSLATKMACPEALMNQEQKFLETFNEISQFDINENGALILKSHNGKTLRGYLLGQ
ncbi:META domain-containing protein [Marinospirillum minutulum]|uniref:META domain-containing protein n=1 Tax=Marinospirillum minutulum TaxID=64974 RepID=UPI000685D6A2|nr:META domain-containing protein [Marinospirillum minutulum]